MSNNTEISISTCYLSCRSACLWSISTKMNQKKFQFHIGVLIRESSQLLVTTWNWTKQSILYVPESTENCLLYHYLAIISGLRNNSFCGMAFSCLKEDMLNPSLIYKQSDVSDCYGHAFHIVWIFVLLTLASHWLCGPAEPYCCINNNSNNKEKECFLALTFSFPFYLFKQC